MTHVLNITVFTPGAAILSGVAVEGTLEQCESFLNTLLENGVGKLILVDDTKTHLVPAKVTAESAFSFEIEEV